MFDNFRRPGHASFVLGGQWGSEGKGAAAAALAVKLTEQRDHFEVVTTNAGCQSGHTSTHQERTRVAFHLPTAAFYLSNHPLVYLNSGAIIDPDVLAQELNEAGDLIYSSDLIIHPRAAVVTQECRDAEMAPDSAQTRIASTRKGVGQALSRKVLRSGMVAREHPFLRRFTEKTVDLNRMMRSGASVLVEIPQGYGLSLNGPFYPYCTSRDCTVMQAMSDAGIHPQYYGASMLVIRTYPIRVGNIEETEYVEGQAVARTLLGQSGSCYLDQRETSWEALGVKAEITTVTKRVRRVFTYSHDQVAAAMAATRPDVVYITFCDYAKNVSQLEEIVHGVCRAALQLKMATPEFVFQDGPTTADAHDHLPFRSTPGWAS